MSEPVDKSPYDTHSVYAAFCKDCFLHFFREQIKRAVERNDMFSATDRLLVAVSGGKDSLAMWDVLHELGYDTTGYHIVLWTGEDYATESVRHTQAFADERGRPAVPVRQPPFE